MGHEFAGELVALGSEAQMRNAALADGGKRIDRLIRAPGEVSKVLLVP